MDWFVEIKLSWGISTENPAALGFCGALKGTERSPDRAVRNTVWRESDLRLKWLKMEKVTLTDPTANRRSRSEQQTNTCSVGDTQTGKLVNLSYSEVVILSYTAEIRASSVVSSSLVSFPIISCWWRLSVCGALCVCVYQDLWVTMIWFWIFPDKKWCCCCLKCKMLLFLSAYGRIFQTGLTWIYCAGWLKGLLLSVAVLITC